MAGTYRLGLVRCHHGFKGISSEEMSLSVGDIVVAEKVLDQKWFFGTRVTDGQSGSFPADHTTRLDLPQLSGAEKVLLAIETFPGQAHGDLSFTKGDVILGLSPIDSNWWEGQGPAGLTGIFPLSFTLDITHFVTKIERWKPTKAIVKTSLKAQLPDEIDLQQGEEILITELIDKSWARAQAADGRVGLVPLGFVKLSEYQSQTPSDSPSNLTAIDQPVVQSSLAEPECPVVPYGVTKWPFIGQQAGELSFVDKETVFLHRYVDSEWCEGEIDGRVGIFPISFVDVMVDLNEIPVVSSKENGYKRQSVDDNRHSTVSSRSAMTEPRESHGTSYPVLFDFAGSEPTDLRCKAGDRVTIVRHINQDWIEGFNVVTRETGILPLCFLDVTPLQLTSTLPSVEPVKLRAHGSDGESVRNGISTDLHSSFSDSPASLPPKDNRQSVSSEISEVNRSSGAFKPPRPQPPVLEVEKPSKTWEELEKERIARLTDRRDLRQKIITELVQTERDYVRDLQVVHNVFKPLTPEIPSNFRLNFESFVAAFPAIVGLAQQLLSGLERQSKRDFDNQEIGSVFLELGAQFQSLYSNFCENLEFIQPLLEKDGDNTELQNKFNECLTSIKSRSSCFDLNSAMSRPIHRILKYPIFLQEILKTTEDNHPDKVKLIQAIRVMGDAAQTINETKRRKDLILKYKRSSDEGMADKLSKLNMHSVRKKGTRFSMRLSSTFGLANVTHDDQFHQCEQGFHQMEKSVLAFLRNIQGHCEQLQLTMSHFECVSESLLDLYGTHSLVAKIRQLDTSWHMVIDKAMQGFFGTINERIRKPLLDLQQLFSGPAKLIEKRNDKLLDFDAASGRAQKANRMDHAKFAQLQEELKRAKSDYECLNTQLIIELPRLLELSQETLVMCSNVFVESQFQFLAKVSQTLSSIEQFVPVPMSTDLASLFNLLKAKQADAVNQMSIAISFVPKGLSTTPSSDSSLISSLRPTTKPSGSSSKKIAPNMSVIPSGAVKETRSFPQKRQSDSSRNLLMSKYESGKLFSALQDHPGTAEMDLAVKRGDLVAVLVKKDPLGNESRWFVDNSEAKGFVPKSILTPFSPPPTTAVHEKPTSVPLNRLPLNNQSSLIDLTSPVKASQPRQHLDDMLDIDVGGRNFVPPPSVSPVPNLIAQMPYYSAVSTGPPRSAVIQQPSMPIKSDPFGDIYEKAKVDVLTHKPMANANNRPNSTCFQPPPPQHQLSDPGNGWHRSSSFTNAMELSQTHKRVAEQQSQPQLPRATATPPSHQQLYQNSVALRSSPPTDVAVDMRSQRGSPSRNVGSLRSHKVECPVLRTSASVDTVIASSTAIVPIRPAPAPPQLPQAVKVESPRSSPEVAVPSREFLMVEYDFTATEANELSVAEGQTVVLLSREDEQGNNEWWLVEDERGNSGFVPSNYLSELMSS